MKKVAVVTATRAEYGLLTPLIRKIKSDGDLILDLIVTGAHLSEKQGYTISEIFEDGFPVSHEIPILDEDNSPYGVSITMANAIKGFAQCFYSDRPDMVVILGDRTEMLGVAAAALNERIPIAHIHGGEVTEGAVDESIRHAITKMSYLHFTSTEIYRKRVIQLGEDPVRVFNVGALGAENILTQSLYDLKGLEQVFPDLKKRTYRKYAVVTFHPVTLETDTAKEQVMSLCGAMSERSDLFFLVTAANADIGGEEINHILKDFCKTKENASFFYSLGMKRYLSAVKYAAFVMGNSSSGILEAPVLGTPTVNIGERQRGRIITDTIINCEPKKQDILEAMEQALKIKHVPTDIYGDGTTSEQIVIILKNKLNENIINLKKGFYDL